MRYLILLLFLTSCVGTITKPTHYYEVKVNYLNGKTDTLHFEDQMLWMDEDGELRGWRTRRAIQVQSYQVLKDSLTGGTQEEDIHI